MTTYSYIARTNDGTIERGDIEASSPEEARERLRKKNLFAEEVQAGTGKPFNVTFPTANLPWTNTDEAPKHKAVSDDAAMTEEYMPFIDTLRLFAGWLLAWYALVYLLGSYQMAGKLPIEIPLVEGLFASPLVLRFAFGNFLFLLLTNIYRWMRGGIMTGLSLSIIGIVIFVLLHLSI